MAERLPTEKVESLHRTEEGSPEDPAAALSSKAGQRLTKAIDSAYQPSVLAEITDAGARERIANVIRAHTGIQLAAFAGREKEIADVANNQTIYVARVVRNGTSQQDKEAIHVGAVKSAGILRLCVSAASEAVPLSEFADKTEYSAALKSKLQKLGDLLAKSTSGERRFKFNVSSGELEIPVSAQIGGVEVSAGSVNLYEVGDKLADKVFGGSSILAALLPSGSSGSADQQPASPELVQHEEQARRQLTADLSDDDLSELKQVAPRLFADS
jgi:hypothetical protein